MAKKQYYVVVRGYRTGLYSAWVGEGGTAEQVVLASGDPEQAQRLLGFRIELDDPMVPERAHVRANIEENSTETSTEFALPWLGESLPIAKESFDEWTAKSILNRPSALEWMEEHYDRTVDRSW